MYIPSWKMPMYEEWRRQSEARDRRDGVDLVWQCGACGAQHRAHANPHVSPWAQYSESDTGGRRRFIVNDYLGSVVCPDCNAVRCHRLISKRGPR